MYEMFCRVLLLLYHCEIAYSATLDSLYLGKYCTFVCGTLFLWMKLIDHYPPKQSSTYIQKYDSLENIENWSRALGVTLDSSTDPNLGHNHSEI